MTRDHIYRDPQSPVPPFEFDDQVVQVFDDMLNRSIPFYGEIICRQVQMIERFYLPGSVIYDLGCSNGNLGLQVCRLMGGRTFSMVAVDNSAPMLNAYQKRLEETSWRERIALQCQDISRTTIENASVVVLNFTLQFLPPEERDGMISRIHAGLQPGGVLLFSEKITHADKPLVDLQQALYYRFKRENGYSDLEISQKREALEKVLIPETMEQHLARLQRAGFNSIETWLKWFNFAALIAVK